MGMDIQVSPWAFTLVVRVKATTNGYLMATRRPCKRKGPDPK